MLSEGTLVTNGHGAVFKITSRDTHADAEGLEYGGYFAEVVDAGKTEWPGMVCYLDDRDFAPGGLTIIEGG